jgi:hypothetical protein
MRIERSTDHYTGHFRRLIDNLTRLADERRERFQVEGASDFGHTSPNPAQEHAKPGRFITSALGCSIIYA